jgi:8-oxoguanine deaminase
MPQTLLLRNADVLVTMDERRREIAGGGVYIEGNRIVAVGPCAELPQAADEVIDLAGHVLLPGLVNTHHHMYQSLTRAVPAAQDAELFGWLKALYPIWAGLTPEMVRVSTKTAMAELILSGCTTSSDHLYIYPNGCRLDDSIEAAEAIGMRFHAARGAMSVGESNGGLPPDRLVENEAAILKETQRLIEHYHDADRFSMRRIVVAPCSPFSVSRDLMREAANLARAYGVSLHTHLAENDNDVAYSREVFGMTPADYAEDLGWVGRDVWHAHCVKLDEAGIKLFGRTGTGVAHCPCSNMRLASGIAPVSRMRCEGVRVGLGVDGCASNDAGHMLGETRQAMLLARVGQGPAAMSARQALEMATRGGAEVLNRDDIGFLAPGMAADLVAFDMRTLDFAGALHDPVAALVFCAPAKVSWSIINGRIVVRGGHLQTVDLPVLVERHNALSRALVRGERPVGPAVTAATSPQTDSTTVFTSSLDAARSRGFGAYEI